MLPERLVSLNTASSPFSMAIITHHDVPEQALKAEQAMVPQFADPALQFDIRLWTTTQALVAPRSLRRAVGIDRACQLSTEAGWPVVFRTTGGEVTPQGPGILNVAIAYALDVSECASIEGVYRMFCAPLIALLADYGLRASAGSVPGSFCDGAYNIVVDGRKIAGTAQRWSRIRSEQPRRIVFAHALILIDADLTAGVLAINRLYEACGRQPMICAGRHVNLAGGPVRRPASVDMRVIARQLCDLYSAELSALTD